MMGLVIAPGLIAVILILVAFANAVTIWRSASAHLGPRRTTLRLLAFNLGEPLINTIVVVLLVWQATRSNWSDLVFFNLDGGLMVTAPVAVLLLPLGWIFSEDPLSRRINIKLAVLGAVRWGVTALTFFQPLCMLIGLIVLGFSIRWVKRQAFVVVGPSYRPIGLGPEGVMVGELTDFVRTPEAQPPSFRS